MHDVILLGASAGGVEALSTIVAELPHDLRAVVMVVLHVSRGRSVLPEILTRSGSLPAVHPGDGEPIHYGRIYVAPPDHHLTVEGNLVRVVHGPSENGVRPAVDPLFRSAARTFGARVIGVILTGSLDDGTAGLAAVKEAGGVAIVQDPAEAFAPGMPQSAIEFVAVDRVLPLKDIGSELVRLTQQPADTDSRRRGPHLHPMEPDLAPEPIAVEVGDRPGQMAVVSCPECHGSLWEVEQGGILRFRCRVGHVYTTESMVAAHTDSVDRALWAALRSLEERAALTRKLSERARQRGQAGVADSFAQRAMAAEEHALVLKELIVNRGETHVVPDTVDTPRPV